MISYDFLFQVFLCFFLAGWGKCKLMLDFVEDECGKLEGEGRNISHWAREMGKWQQVFLSAWKTGTPEHRIDDGWFGSFLGESGHGVVKPARLSDLQQQKMLMLATSMLLQLLKKGPCLRPAIPCSASLAVGPMLGSYSNDDTPHGPTSHRPNSMWPGPWLWTLRSWS